MKRISKGNETEKKVLPFYLIPLSFFLIEVFAFLFLGLEGSESFVRRLWPLAFAACWAVFLAAVIRMLPWKIARVVYGITYFVGAVYAGFQTGYYVLFSEMMWLSEFRYASEGSDYASVLLSYPIGWWIGIFAMIAQGVVLLWKFPGWKKERKHSLIAAGALLLSAVCIMKLPAVVFLQDNDEEMSDYKRVQSAEAAYENMFNVHRLYQVCGLFQTMAKDVYTHDIYPLTPGYVHAQEEARAEINAYFSQRQDTGSNDMTGLLAGKNVVLVLMESLDDWMLGEHTPTINRLMEEGISFTRFYTPVYGGIRTFNSEFCMNTGLFLSSQGGYAFDYVTNSFHQSLPSLLRDQGYSALTFHYNSPEFYSRGEFSVAMGYDAYTWYADYQDWSSEEATRRSQEEIYDDQLLFDNQKLNQRFFRDGSTLNFIITNAAHLSYKYSDGLSQWGLKKYPQYKGLTGNEETDCAYLKAKLVDDMFARLMTELEEKGRLQNTVVIGVCDHYTYGYENRQELLRLSGVSEQLLLEKTPCFIWSADLESMKVDKVLNTSDLLPTVLNLLGVDSPYDYIGRDAFDEGYEGFVPFSDGGWIYGDIAYDASSGKYISVTGSAMTVSAEVQKRMAETVEQLIRINNLILETDYYNQD